MMVFYAPHACGRGQGGIMQSIHASVQSSLCTMPLLTTVNFRDVITIEH